jgi:hypothetical protein
MLQAPTSDGLLRGAKAIADHINSRMAGGEPLSVHAAYRLIVAGKIPVTRLGGKRTEVWTTKQKVDDAFGLTPPAEASEPAEREAA